MSRSIVSTRSMPTASMRPGAIGAIEAERRSFRAVEDHPAAIGGAAFHRRQKSDDGRHADAAGLGEGDEQLAEPLGLPDRPRADETLVHHGDIDQGDLTPAVDRDLEALVGDEGRRCAGLRR